MGFTPKTWTDGEDVDALDMNAIEKAIAARTPSVGMSGDQLTIDGAVVGPHLTGPSGAPTIDMSGDQFTVNGTVVGPHLTGPQGDAGKDGAAPTDANVAPVLTGTESSAAIGDVVDAHLGGDSTGLVTQVAEKVAKGSIVVNVMDHGAIPGGDEATNTAAIQAALDSDANQVLVPAGTFAASQVTVGNGVELIVSRNATLSRSASSSQTGPLVWLNKNNARVSGGGLIYAANDCPDGVLRIERTDAPCEWGRVNDVHIQGPGASVAGSTGVVFAGTSGTFQNRLAGVTISDVETGTYHSGSNANMNHITDATLYHIGSVAHHFDGTVETVILGGSVQSSPGVTVLNFTNGATMVRAIGLVAEPGGTSTFRNIDSSCSKIQLIGCSNNTSSLGTDSAGDTTELLNKHFRMLGGDVGTTYRAVLATDAVVNNSTAYSDTALSLPVESGATYRMEGFLVYSGSDTADIKVRLTGTNATAGWTMRAPATNSSTAGPGTFGYQGVNQGSSAGCATSNAKTVALIDGTVTATGAGGVTIGFAQITADASDTTIYTGSWLTLRRQT